MKLRKPPLFSQSSPRSTTPRDNSGAKILHEISLLREELSSLPPATSTPTRSANKNNLQQQSRGFNAKTIISPYSDKE
eukprot:Pgem_evm1s16916